MKKIALFALAVLVLLKPAFAYANPAAKEKKEPLIHIAFTISGAEAIEMNLNFCLKTQLEKFDDITVVLDNADWKLDVIGSRMPARGNYDQDYVFSLAVLKRAPEGRYILQGHELMAGFPNLQSACREITLLFAKKYLEKNPKGIIEPYQKNYGR